MEYGWRLVPAASSGREMYLRLRAGAATRRAQLNIYPSLQAASARPTTPRSLSTAEKEACGRKWATRAGFAWLQSLNAFMDG